MKRHLQSGKMKLSSIIIVAIVCYAGFCVFKLVSANMTEGQIRTDIGNEIGIERGPSFTVAEGEKIVRNVLKRHGVLESDFNDDDPDVETESDENYEGEHQRIVVEINQKTTMVHFFTNFHITIDYIFFKQVKYYEVEGEVQNFN